MKQTAVEWLVEQILIEVQDYEDGDIETESEPFKHEYVNKYIGMVDLSEFVNKAKAMEKEQIIRTHLMARCYDTENSVNEAEQYYKETYESNTRI